MHEIKNKVSQIDEIESLERSNTSLFNVLGRKEALIKSKFKPISKTKASEISPENALNDTVENKLHKMFTTFASPDPKTTKNKIKNKLSVMKSELSSKLSVLFF